MKGQTVIWWIAAIILTNLLTFMLTYRAGDRRLYLLADLNVSSTKEVHTRAYNQGWTEGSNYVVDCMRFERDHPSDIT